MTCEHLCVYQLLVKVNVEHTQFFDALAALVEELSRERECKQHSSSAKGQGNPPCCVRYIESIVVEILLGDDTFALFVDLQSKLLKG